MCIECLNALSQISVTTHLFVTMEGALLIMICVMAIMTVEITATKMDVSDDRWEETHCIFIKPLLIERHLVNH